MRIALLLIALASAYVGNAQNLSDKIAGYFSFDNCVGKDDSGNGSSGALLGTVGCACGARDSALRFDNLNDALYLVGPLTDIFTRSDFTVSFYMKPIEPTEQPGGTQLILAKQGGCDNNKAFWVRYSYPSNTITSAISENDTSVVTVSAKLSSSDCWHHIVLIRSNTRYALYVNGELKDSESSKRRYDLSSSAGVKVGEPVCPLDRAYFGDLDEMRFYSKALDDDTRKLLYTRPDRIVNSDTLIYLGNAFQIDLTETCAEEFAWTPREGVSDPLSPTPIIMPQRPTVYYVQMDHENCISTDSIVVEVIDPDTLDCSKIFVPNAFTPGASFGRNDVFGISNPFAVGDFVSFEVFDRWGGRVFAAASPFDTWDGTSHGQAVNPGIFLYRLRYRCKGEEKIKSGTLTLLR